MKQKNRGFIYLWYDRKHKRFYLGKHWGEPNDGYICSSKWMISSYKRRPDDFKRRLIKFYFTKEELADSEVSWGKLIKDSELGTRYYNLKRPNKNHHKRDTKGQKRTDEQRRRISDGTKKAMSTPDIQARFLKENKENGLLNKKQFQERTIALWSKDSFLEIIKNCPRSSGPNTDNRFFSVEEIKKKTKLTNKAINFLLKHYEIGSGDFIKYIDQGVNQNRVTALKKHYANNPVVSNKIETKCFYCQKIIMRYPSLIKPRNFCCKSHAGIYHKPSTAKRSPEACKNMREGRKLAKEKREQNNM